MIRHLHEQPQLAVGLGVAGLLMLTMSILIFPSNGNGLQIASATHCGTTEYPADSEVSDNTWASYWRVGEWLVFNPNNGPELAIGPATWKIRGKTKPAGQVAQCYKEDWVVTGVVLASNRDADRGLNIDMSNTGQATYPANQSRTLRKVNRNTATTDPIFSPQNNEFSQLGQYGVLKTNKDELEKSISFFPTVWKVTGSRQ